MFKNESDLISFIVDNNSAAVRENLARALGNKNVNNWSKEDIKRKLINLFNSGYDISEIVNVPVLNLSNTFPDFKMPEGKFAGGLGFGDVLLALAGALVAGSPIGNVLFPQQTGTGAQPLPASDEQNKSWFQRNKKWVVGSGVALILIVVLFLIFRKK